ncbi:uncharacterized protein LOC120089295 [Benincasa hispida]|uniref:uncharacterized protein LOC120089295 n=1 Tax=Benincasa hispida TaxID=102211 RepID=UPI001902ABA9|nr:uncharacterized protein LOC120089295 [Benincasa hispida]XP_038902652.1 uncharacterized protein LOC120089295 [Benincasa hispida]XP_038902653.1 uncharacterized protein LOC120089295 [Benincasa hispida]XP_038902654.1 uncharacterized protein LOC120089295 [Benincasa hispida]XP_038902655.1 uncharacterized protein LOC120089295 [Benincasa hispida]
MLLMVEVESKEKNSKMKSKKRKLKSPIKTVRPSKSARVFISAEVEDVDETERVEKLAQREVSQESEEGGPWRNLELILFVQNKELDQQKKVEAVFGFVNSKLKEKDKCYDTVKISRLIVFLSDWVQSLLISSQKKTKNDGGKHINVVVEPCLDYRCWEVFKFCLEESVKTRITLNLSKNLLHAFCFVTRHAISLLAASLSSKEELFGGDCFKLYNIVLDCVSLVFSPHLGLSNENLDAWISTIDAALEFLHIIYVNNLEGGDVGTFAIKFSCMMLEPFAKFLWIHPTKKTGFHNFVNKLLERLLQLLCDISLKADGCKHYWTRTLMKLLEEVLSHALFHTVHIEGFLCLHGPEKVMKSHDEKLEESKAHIMSYHRHLFDKVQKLVAGKKFLALGAVGELFHVLVVRVKKVKEASMSFEDTKLNNTMGLLGPLRDDISSHASFALLGSPDGLSEKSNNESNLSTEIRRSLFEFFVQILHPLLQTIELISAEIKLGSTLSDVHSLLKSINNVLASFMKENVYLRTEDNSEGACHNFLKKVYDTIMLVSSHLLLLSRLEIESNIDLEVFVLAANEILVTLGYLLEIEYDVIENDLVSLWMLILSYSAFNLSFTSVSKQHLLTSKIQELGCQLVVLYSQLRQVNISIFALCKAMRAVVSNEGETEKEYASFMTSLGHEAYGKSVGMLLSSQDIKFAIHKAIKYIPEGQASGIIQQLTEDVTETLGWLKLCNLNLIIRNKTGGSDMQPVLLGRGFSEVYALILDSLMITSGNAFQVGTLIANLVSAIRPCMSSLVGLQSDGAKAFFLAVMGKTWDDLVANEENCLGFGVASHWVFIFFFRLYMSCRSLYRQAISLMPPSSSRKMSTATGDSFMAYSACDWMQRTDWSDEGYFSWIIQPSASVLFVVESVCSLYHQSTNVGWYPLIYVLLTMAIQRLVDLNKQIGSLEYLHQRNENLMQVEVLSDDDLSVLQKKRKKFGRLVSVLRKEAEDLTDFVMSHLSLVAKRHKRNATSNDKSTEILSEIDEWDFNISNVNKRSFPTAVWWIVCQNIDIWVTHAAKKKLKMFISFLIPTSLCFFASNHTKIGTQQTCGYRQPKKVSLQQISSAVLSDPIFYEHRFVCRFMPSRFCRELKASLLSYFHVIYRSPADWMEVIATLECLTIGICSGQRTPDDNALLDNRSSDMLHTEDCKLKGESRQSNRGIRDCKYLINLLCLMPMGNMSSRSFSLYTTYVLELERILVNALLDNQTALCSNQFELLKLFASCRKALKYIFTAYYEADNRQSSSTPIPSENRFPVLWLFKSLSLINQIQEASRGGTDRQIKDIIFSLMDHTSYLFLTTSKYQFKEALCISVNDNKPCKEQHQDVCQELNDGDDLCLDSIHSVEVCNSAIQMINSLEEQVESELLSLKKSNFAVGDAKNSTDMCKFNSLASCLNGFLWGLASAIDHTDFRNGNRHVKSIKLKCEYSSRLNHCMNAISEFLGLILDMFLDRDSQWPTKLCDYQASQDLLIVNELSGKHNSEADTSFSELHELESFYRDDKSENASTKRRRLKVENKSSFASVLNEAKSIEMQSLNQPFFRGLLKGSYPEAEFALKQLFLAASRILRLHKQYDTTPLSSRSMTILISISRFLLLEFVDMVEVPQPFVLSCLDGVLKYLEELGHLFPFADPVQSRNIYSKLINLHLKAVGKCICLQGKGATLASHETESTTKTLDGGLFKESSFPGVYCMDEFKSSLRMSFKVFIREASELHLLSAVQAIERALVGVQEGCTTIYELYSGSEDGGRCSSVVAAGVECLDLVLEFVSGRKCMGVIKRHIESLTAALFSIVLHLQSPQIFYVRMIATKNRSDPDPGSVILMSIEVLTRVSGKHALFQMNVWHVAQCLRIPAALFKTLSLKLPGIPIESECSLISAQEASNVVVPTSNSIIDKQFSIDLFAGCCRLLYTILKHRKSECKRSIAQLQASVSVLLHSLERVGPDPKFMGGYFSWKVEEGVKCASFLRRIYEEIRQQRDIVGRHCSLFLSNYVWVYSGHGPLKSGIRREINEALRPGVYALIDACSAEDLQYLHTVFGEGPCRNTLATLQQDYKQFFQYEGKV